MARTKYQPRSDAEDARLWRDLMAYFDAWPYSPYTDIEASELASRIRALRSSRPTLHDLAQRIRESLIRSLLTTDEGRQGLIDSMQSRAQITHRLPPMQSAYDGISWTRERRLTRAQRVKMWEQDRTTVANRWFNGDQAHADAALDALPYSEIPTWVDVDQFMRTITGHAEEETDE